jgi:hypothetical protein
MMDRHGDRLSKPSGWRVRQCELSGIAQDDFARDCKTKTGAPGGTDGIGAKEWLHRALEQVIGYAVSTIEDFDPRDRSGGRKPFGVERTATVKLGLYWCEGRECPEHRTANQE